MTLKISLIPFAHFISDLYMFWKWGARQGSPWGWMWGTRRGKNKAWKPPSSFEIYNFKSEILNKFIYKKEKANNNQVQTPY